MVHILTSYSAKYTTIDKTEYEYHDEAVVYCLTNDIQHSDEWLEREAEDELQKLIATKLFDGERVEKIEPRQTTYKVLEVRE